MMLIRQMTISTLLAGFLFVGLSGNSVATYARSSDYTKQTVQEGFYHNAEGSPLLDLIEQSRSTIDIELYSMTDLNIIGALKQAVKRGVRVRAIQEPSPVGGGCKLFTEEPKTDTACQELKSLLKLVNNSGGSYVPFNKASLCSSSKPGVKGATANCLQHGKILISDGKFAMLSTGNFNATNLCDEDENPSVCNRDFTYVAVDTAVVKGIKKIFDLDLKGKPYNLSSITDPLKRVMTVSPVAKRSLTDFIKRARKRVQIQNQYIKDPDLIEAIVATAKRGVRVEITISSVCSFGPPTSREREVLQPIFESFENAGVDLRFFTEEILVNGRHGYLHAKAIVVDDQSAWVGSINGSTQSLDRNREFGVFFDNEYDVQKLSKIMNSDQRNRGTETWQESFQCLKDREHPAGGITK